MPLPVIQYRDLRGGVNKLVSQSLVADNESPNLQNIEYVENGIPGKRRGQVLDGDASSGVINGIGSLYLVAGTKMQLRVKGTALQKKVTGTWTDISGATFSGNNVFYVQNRNALYIFDGGAIKKFDGTTLSTVTSSPSVSFGINYGDRVVSAGDPVNKSRLHFCVPGLPDGYGGSEGTATSGTTTTITDSTKTWVTNQFAGFTVLITAGINAGQSRTVQSNTANTLTVESAYGTAINSTSKYQIAGGDTLDISKDDGQNVMALGKFEDKLIVFKERSSYQLTFDSYGFPIVQQISSFIGCVSHGTVDMVENDLFYLSNDGVRTFGYVAQMPQVIRTNKLSSKIEPEIQNINTTYYQKCCAIYHDNKYMLSVPSGSVTTNNRVLVFQLLYGCWTIWTGWNISCFNEFVDTDKKVKLYGGDALLGNSYELLSGYNDNGVAIQSYWYSKQFDLGYFSLFKKVVFCDIQIRSLTGTLGLDIIVDGNLVAKTIALSSSFSQKDGVRVFMYREAMAREDAGSVPTSIISTDDVRRIKIQKKCRNIQIKVYNNNLDENFTLMSFAFGARQKSSKSFDSNKIIY